MKKRHQERINMEPDEKTCPFCAETIKAAAKVCKHCGRDLDEKPAPPSPGPDQIKCPFCFYPVSKFAAYCAHCGKVFSDGKPNAPVTPEPITTLQANEKACPFCKEPVNKDAKVCKHCGKKLVKGFFDGCGTAIIILACVLVALKILGII